MGDSNAMDLPQDFRDMSDPDLPIIARVAARVLTNSFTNISTTNLILADVETAPYSSPSAPLDYAGCMSATFWLRDTVNTNYIGDMVEFRARGYSVVVSLEGRVPEQAIWECDELYKRYDLQGKWLKSMYSCLPVNEIVYRNGKKVQQSVPGYPPQGVGTPEP